MFNTKRKGNVRCNATFQISFVYSLDSISSLFSFLFFMKRSTIFSWTQPVEPNARPIRSGTANLAKFTKANASAPTCARSSWLLKSGQWLSMKCDEKSKEDLCESYYCQLKPEWNDEEDRTMYLTYPVSSRYPKIQTGIEISQNANSHKA